MMLGGVSILVLLFANAQQQPSLPAAEALIGEERLAEAEQMLEALRSRDSGTEVQFRLAYVQFRLRKLEAARLNFASIVISAPPAFNSRYFLGRIALLENKPQEAVRWFEPIRETIYDVESQLALAYRGAGQPARAIAPLKAAIQRAPWDGSLYYRLGQLHQQLGQPALAMESLETSRRLRQAAATDGQALMAVHSAIEAGKTTEAANLGRTILERKDVDPATLVALGLTWVSAGMPAAALETFELAARRDRNLFAAQFNYGLALLRNGRAEDAVGPLALAVRLLPQSFDANLSLGIAAVMLQRYQEARGPLEAARRLAPSNPRVASLLATSYLRTGQPEEALKLLRTSIELEGQLLLVEALNATSNTESALEAARKVAKEFPREATAQMALAQQLARVGRYQEAGPIFEAVLRLNPSNPEAMLGLGDVKQKAGDHAAAIESYKSALNYRTTTLAARLGAARSLIALKQLELARQILEEGLPNHGSESALRLELSRVYSRLGLSDLAAREVEQVNRLKAAESKP